MPLPNLQPTLQEQFIEPDNVFFRGAHDFVVDFACPQNNVRITRIIQVVEPWNLGQIDRAIPNAPSFSQAHDFNLYLIPLLDDMQTMENAVMRLLQGARGAEINWLDLYPPGAFGWAYDFVINTNGPTSQKTFSSAYNFVVNTTALSRADAFKGAREFVVNTTAPSEAGAFMGAYDFVINTVAPSNADAFNGAEKFVVNTTALINASAFSGAWNFVMNTKSRICTRALDGARDFVTNTEGKIDTGALDGARNFTINSKNRVDTRALEPTQNFRTNEQVPIAPDGTRLVLIDTKDLIKAGTFRKTDGISIITKGPINAGALEGSRNFTIYTEGPINKGALDDTRRSQIYTKGPIRAGALKGACGVVIEAKGPVDAGALRGSRDVRIDVKGSISPGALGKPHGRAIKIVEKAIRAMESTRSVVTLLECAGIDQFMPPRTFANACHFGIYYAMSNSGQTKRIERILESRGIGNRSYTKWSVLSDAFSATTTSANRDIPRRHPSTFTRLMDRMKEWCKDKTPRMLWLQGRARSGKSAVAQTIGEEYKASFGCSASFFFSRSNRRDDPSTVIPTLVLQLMTQIPEYKHLITERFTADPSFLERDLHTQFEELIVDPFRTLHSLKPFEHPVLIILDGLDECNSKEAQCEFINLITDHAHSQTNSPLIWLVCSRPEWHLKRMFSDPDFGDQWRRDEVSADDEEARADVLLVLRDGLQDIQRHFSDRLSVTWPGEAAVTKIAAGSFNLFTVVTTIVRFIGDENAANPDGRLQACLESIQNDTSSSMAGENPVFDALESLYGSVFQRVPSTDLPVVLKILFLRILYPGTDLCVSLHANVLGLTRSTFYAALEGMHSVLSIPPLEHADGYGIQLYNASFEKYLRNPSRTLAWNTMHCDVLIECLRWLKPLTSQNCILEGNKKCHALLPPLTWSSDLDERVVFNQICDVVARSAWDACCRISDPSTISIALQACRDFDFRHLVASIVEVQHFVPFLNWLHDVDTRGLLLGRAPIQPKTRTAHHLDSKSTNMFPLNPTLCQLEFISSHTGKKPSKRRQLGAFFLGSGTGACLVCILPDVSRIVDLIKQTISLPDNYKVLLEKQGTDAQQIIDIFQAVLDSQELQSDDTPPSAILQALLRLARQSRLYPRQFILEGVTIGDGPVTAGGFGDIWMGKYQHRQVCIKIIRTHLQGRVTESLAAPSREAILWSQLRHPNVLPFYGIVCDAGRTGLVSPWMSDGNMMDYLKSNPNSSRLPLVHDMLAGLSCLHRRDIVHGDLKGHNVLIRRDGSACLADFGVSAVADHGGLPFSSYQLQTEACINMRWTAPELLEMESPRPTLQHDIYSLASLMLQTFTGEVPYPHMHMEIMVMSNLLRGMRPERPDKEAAPELTDPIWEIMQKSWSKEPTDRPTIEQIIEQMTACAPLQGERVVEEWDIPHTRNYELSYSDATLLKTTFNL